MKKYFVFGDAHGFCSKLKKALKKKGFDIKNPEHILISLGDEFDRGSEAIKMLDFLRKMQKLNRLILIRGNHTDLMWKCLFEINEYGCVIHDNHYSNGTVGTIAQFVNDDNITMALNSWRKLTLGEIDKVNKSLEKWKNLIKSDKNYLEIGKYVFVHGWIPTQKNWRSLPEISEVWDEARWMGFPQAIKNGWIEPGETIVCGHWHCSAYWGDIKHERKPFPDKNRKGWEKSFDPAITPDFIAIDACTAYSGMVNILVFEETSENNIVLLDSN